MFWKRTGVVCLGMASAAAALPAQDPFIFGFAAQAAPQAPAAPAAPQAPAAPRAKQITVFNKAGGSYLGVGLAEVTDERAKALNLRDTHGVEVKHVDDNSPAAKAGMKDGDVILDYNGQRVEGVEQFIRMIAETPAGRKANLAIWRGGSSQTISATLEARNKSQNMFIYRGGSGDGFPPMPDMPDMPPIPSLPDMSRFTLLTMNSTRVGIEGETLTSQLADFFGVKHGVLVRAVTAKSAADKAGMKAGDVITKVGGTPVMGLRDITGAVRSGRSKVGFTVVRNKKEMTIDLEVPEARMMTSDKEIL